MKKSTRTITSVAIFAAIATILMTFKFPAVFLAPPFYKLDASEAVVMLAGFSMGVVPAVLVELIKVLLNLVIDGTVTAGIGEASNFLIGCLLVVPAVVIYRRFRTFLSAVIGALVGVAAMAAGAAIINYYLLIPAYCTAFGIEAGAIISMGTAINASIVDLKSFVLICTVPFNLVKGGICAAVALLTIKPLEIVMKRVRGNDREG